MTTYAIGQSYTFNTRAPAILGSVKKNHTLRAIADYGTACHVTNVDLLHRQVYPLLPMGTASDATKYTYLILQSPSGETVVMATVWIDESTVAQVTEEILTITIHTTSSTLKTQLQETLTLMGITSFTIETGTVEVAAS